MQIICKINIGDMNQDVYYIDNDKLTKMGITSMKSLASDLESYANAIGAKEIILQGPVCLLGPTIEILEEKDFKVNLKGDK